MTKVIMRIELKKDPHLPYREHTEYESKIKMLDASEALLISEPKIKFDVPIKVALPRISIETCAS